MKRSKFSEEQILEVMIEVFADSHIVDALGVHNRGIQFAKISTEVRDQQVNVLWKRNAPKPTVVDGLEGFTRGIPP